VPVAKEISGRLKKTFARGRFFSLHTDETDGALNSNEQSL
jgi:hypothetical protein